MCSYTMFSFDPLICWWTSRLAPYLGHREQYFSKHDVKEGTGCVDLDFLGFACCLQFPEERPPDFHCGLADLHPDWQPLGVQLPLHPYEYFSSFVTFIAIWLVRHEIPVQIKFASPRRLRIFNFFFQLFWVHLSFL